MHSYKEHHFIQVSEIWHLQTPSNCQEEWNRCLSDGKGKSQGTPRDSETTILPLLYYIKTNAWQAKAPELLANIWQLINLLPTFAAKLEIQHVLHCFTALLHCANSLEVVCPDLWLLLARKVASVSNLCTGKHIQPGFCSVAGIIQPTMKHSPLQQTRTLKLSHRSWQNYGPQPVVMISDGDEMIL